MADGKSVAEPRPTRQLQPLPPVSKDSSKNVWELFFFFFFGNKKENRFTALFLFFLLTATWIVPLDRDRFGLQKQSGM